VPENLTLVLVGDFKSKEALAMAQKYFGRLKRGKKTVPDVITMEMPQKAEKRFYAEAETNPNVDIYWHTPAFGHKDTYALSVLSKILTGNTGRLKKELVLKSKLSTDTFAWTRGMQYAGQFNAGGEVADGKDPAAVEAAIHAVIEKLKTEPVPAKELQKVKNNFAAAEYRRLTSNHPILMQIIRNEGTGDWRELNTAGAKLQAVTPADIQRVANKYFTKENRAVAIYTRKPGTGGGGDEDPLLAGLSSQQKAMARKVISSVNSEKDLAVLKSRLKQLEAQLEEAGAKAPPIMKVIRAALRKRIGELEK
jgi:predicted Zn-dependent peptidase